MFKPVLNHPKLHLGLLLLVVFLGALARWQSVNFNVYPHGDVIIEVEAVAQSNETGIFTMRHHGSNHELAAKNTYQIVITDKPPIWILLVEAYQRLTHQLAYTAAKHASFIAGLTLLVSSYLLVGKLVNKPLALLVSSIIAFNHFFIDYSGNGSRYMLTAILITCLFYLLFDKRQNHWRYLAIGCVYSLIFQNTYQLATLIIPIIMSLFILNPRREWKRMLLILPAAVLTLTPYLIYNLSHYGVPLLTTNEQYLGNILGIPSSDTWTGQQFITHYVDSSKITRAFLPVLPMYMFKNAIFLTKKTLVIFPFAFVLAWLWFDQLRKRQLNKEAFILACFSLFYALQVLALNVVKFRYTLLLYLLLILLTPWLLKPLSHRLQFKLAAFLVGSTVLLTLATHQANPYHTYYFDGVLTPDQFNEAGEFNYMEKMASHAQFAKQIPADAVIQTDLERAYFIPNPIVMPDPFSFGDQAQDIINHYQIEYIWSGGKLDPNLITTYNLGLVTSAPDQFLYLLPLSSSTEQRNPASKRRSVALIF